MNRLLPIIRISLIALVVFLPISISAQIPGTDTNSVNYKLPQEYIIGKITITGADNLNPEAIKTRTGLYEGKEVVIPGDDIADAVKRVWKMGLFSDVQIYSVEKIGKVVDLEIRVQERPRLSNFGITGIKKSESDEIKKKIRLQRGDPVTSHDRAIIHNAVNDYYTEKGFPNSSVEIIEKADTSTPNSVAMTLLVNKGQRVKIEDIIITGNRNVPSYLLRNAMKNTKKRTQIDFTKERNVAGLDTTDRSLLYVLGDLSYDRLITTFNDRVTLNIFSSSKYKPADYKADKKALIDYYNGIGYRDATIISDSIYMVDSARMNIIIHVDEGQKYYFRSIAFEGNTKFRDEDLSKILDIQRGDVYSKSYLEKKLFFDIYNGDISSLYMDQGYLFFNVTPEEAKVEGDSIDVLIRIYEGPQATVNRVTIKGNDKTKDYVIRRELRTLPGDKFSRANLIRSQREIAALGFFDPEQIGINPQPNPQDGTVDIEYTVVEKPSDQVELSAGWGGAVGGLFGSAGVSFNNFSIQNLFNFSEWDPLPSGDGQKFSFRLQTNGKIYQSSTFSFTEPWLGGKKPNSLTTSLNYTLYNPSGIDKDEAGTSFFITRGATVAYGLRLKFPDDYFTFVPSLSYQNYFLKNYNGFVQEGEAISHGHANNLYLKLTLSRNATQGNPLFPTSGSNFSLSFQTTPLYSKFDKDLPNKPLSERFQWVEYHKTRFNAEWYARLAGGLEQGKRQLVLRAGAKFGFLGAWTDAMGLSPFERFRVGGDGLSGGFSLTGFDIISLRGTEDAFVPVGGSASNNLNNAATNAAIFNKFTLELRYPFSTNPNSTIYGMLFAEGGNSYASFEYYDPFKLRRSVGFGLRVYLPMFGLLGFDYGIGFDEPGMEGTSFGEKLSRGAFHFKLGFEPE